MVVPLELGDEESIRAAVGEVVGRWGGIDVLVANAVEWGAPVWEAPPFEEVSPEGWRKTFQTTVGGVFHVVLTVLPSMRERGWARIVLLSSGSVEYGMPGGGAYGAARAALHGLSRSLARELGSSDVLVNVVMPGLVLTERNLRMVPSRCARALPVRARAAVSRCPKTWSRRYYSWHPGPTATRPERSCASPEVRRVWSR